MSDKFHVGKDLVSYADNGKYKPVSRVTLMLDNDNCITAGDDTGLELVADCPFATQEMADILLASFAGYVYKAYEAVAANLDPSAELGDGLTADSHYVVISRIDDDGTGYPTLSAPGEAEMEDEYPSLGPQTQQFNRQLAQTRSLISKTAEEIRLEVFGEDGPGDESLRSEIAVELSKITSTVEGKIDGEAAQSLIDQSLEKIELSVSSSKGSTTFSLTSDGAELSAETLNLSVNAVNVYGKLTADQIDATELEVDAANITGTLKLSQMASISFEDLSDYESVQSDIDDAYWMAYYAEKDVADITYTYNGKTYIDESRIMSGTVIAGSLQGGSVSLLDRYENVSGVMALSPASTATYAVDIESYGGLRLLADAAIYIEALGGGAFVGLTSTGVSIGRADLLPSSKGTYSCGIASFYWSDVYAANATIQTSDREKKTDIVYGLDTYDALFDALRPVSFLFKDGTSGRRHLGMIAQDVEDSLADLGLSSLDFAGFIKSERTDECGNVIEGEYDYALRYGELIPMCVEQIQRLKQRVAALEGNTNE